MVLTVFAMLHLRLHQIHLPHRAINVLHQLRIGLFQGQQIAQGEMNQAAANPGREPENSIEHPRMVQGPGAVVIR